MRTWRGMPLIVIALAIPALAMARQQPNRPCANPSSIAYRQFDFWVGNWEVTDSAGAQVYGTNSVTLEEGECLVHEHWVGARGGTGQSLNFVDNLTGRWTQVWVGNDGLTLAITGGLEGKAMVLAGNGVGTNGKPVLHRVSWTPTADGRVRQYWLQSTDGGKAWTVSFDGWYRRRP